MSLASLHAGYRKILISCGQKNYIGKLICVCNNGIYWLTELYYVLNCIYENCCNVCAFLDEPNNDRYTGSAGEDCLTLWYRRNELNDIHCTFKSKGYVCEKDSKLVYMRTVQ